MTSCPPSRFAARTAPRRSPSRTLSWRPASGVDSRGRRGREGGSASLIVGETDEEAADLDRRRDEEIAALGRRSVTRRTRGLGRKRRLTTSRWSRGAVYDIRSPDGESVDEHIDAAEEPAIAAVYAEAFDFTPRDRNEDDSAAAVAARLRQDSERHSMFGELVKVVLGGVVGLAIGYYLLNFFGGPTIRLLSLYLPGCPHTYHHWPAGRMAAEMGIGPHFLFRYDHNSARR